MVTATLKKWRISLCFLVIHTLLVYAVYKSWLFAMNSSQRYDDPALIWLWPTIFDLPASILVRFMHPRMAFLHWLSPLSAVSSG